MTGERRSGSGPGHRSPFNLLHLLSLPGCRRKSARHTPPGRKKPFRCVIFFAKAAYPSTSFDTLRSHVANSVEMTGFEPVTFALQRRCSPAELHPQDLPGLVGLTGFEPVTPALSAQCSNQLSYKPGGPPQQLRSDRKLSFCSFQHPNHRRGFRTE